MEQIVDSCSGGPNALHGRAADGGTVGGQCSRPLDIRVAEQVIEVPKIVCPPRAARTVLCAPQPAEQLVEVPTPVSYSSSLQRSMEQIVDIPASRRGVSGSLRGFPP